MDLKDIETPLCYCSVCDKHVRYPCIKAHTISFNHKCNVDIYNKNHNKQLTINDPMVITDEMKQQWKECLKIKNKKKNSKVVKCEYCNRSYSKYYYEDHIASDIHKLIVEVVNINS